MTPIKIRIGIPLYDGKVKAECKRSIDAVIAYNDQKTAQNPNPFIFEIVPMVGTSSFFARNKAAGGGSQKTRQIVPFDYYLSLDGDISFSIDNIIRLVKKYEEIKKHQKHDTSDLPIGIIGAAYGGRGAGIEHKIVAGQFDEVPGNIPHEKWVAYDCMAYKCVNWVGTGFMLIPKDVFDSLPYPWFRPHVITIGDESELATEDIAICMDVQMQLKRSIWIDCSNRVAHLVS